MRVASTKPVRWWEAAPQVARLRSRARQTAAVAAIEIVLLLYQLPGFLL
jgi:hypothetical protein